MTTFATPFAQIEALYVGYFGRAGDPKGANYWIDALNAGSITLAQAAAAFATQPEATAKYPYLAAPNVADPGAFVDQVYQNLFNHAADAAGKAYWVAQLQAASGNPQAVGQFILNVISGATGADDATIRNKVDVAQDFTTKAANLGAVWNGTTSSQSSLELTTVTDQASSVTAAKAETVIFFSTAPAAQLNFTLGIDSLETTAANANFNAPLIFNPATGAQLQSLQTGDSAIDSGPNGNLTAFLNSGGNMPLVTLQGLRTATITSLAAGSGISGKITGLTTLNNSGSTGSLSLGVLGEGLGTALATVNISGSGVGGGANTLALIAASALSGAADAVAVNLTGAIGTSTVGVGAAQVVLMHDGTMGTDAAPMNAYETQTISSANTAFLQLSNAGTGVLSTMTLNLKGAGALQLSAATPTDFSNLMTIDASATTGGVTITGLTDVFDASSDPFNAGAAGLLAANTSLASFDGGSGADRLDISFMTPAQVAAFTTLAGGAGRDTLVLGSAVLTSGIGVPGTGFEIIGVAADLAGTIDVAKLGANVDTIQLLDLQLGDVTINNAPSTFTLRADGYALGLAYTIQGPGGSADTLNIFDQLALGTLSLAGYETVNLTAEADEFILAIDAKATPGSATTLNIINDSSECGCDFNIEILSTTDVGPGTINVSGSGTGGVAFLDLVTASALNASALNITADPTERGIGMGTGATGSIAILGSNGSDFLIGSAFADVINGGPGEDIISNTNEPAVAAGDILTGGGGDDIIFLVNNAASDLITTSYGNAPLITDLSVDPTTFGTDFVMLGPDSAAYGVTNLQADFTGPADIPFQVVGASGTTTILNATNEIVKLSVGAVTAGLTLQQAFDAAIGSVRITDATADGDYFFIMYDVTNSRMAIGIVSTSNSDNTTIEAGDEVVLVGSATMSSVDYAKVNTNQFVFDFPS